MPINGVYTVVIVFINIILMPLMACIALLIFILDGAPVLFYQRRMGRHKIPFTIYKFRTMKRNAEKLKRGLYGLNEADGPVFKIRNDPRYTSFGRFLAHTGLDELPQVWNVLRGDMALIGPRPLPVDEAKKLTPWQQKRHAIKPGIISPWILDGYHTQTFDAWMKSDIDYISKKSFISDAGICLRACRFLLQLFFRELRARITA